MTRLFWVGAACFIAGVVGNMWATSFKEEHWPPPETVTQTEVKEVEVPVEVEVEVEVPFIPEQCLSVIEKVSAIEALSSGMSSTASRQYSILDRSTRAIAQQDLDLHNQLKQEQLDLNREAVEAWQVDLSQEITSLNILMSACEKEIP